MAKRSLLVFPRATDSVQLRSTESYPFSLMLARAEATASALDSGIYRYPPFSIFSFMDCLTASGVTAASRTVSTVCERRVGVSGLVGVPFAFCGRLSTMVLSSGLPVSTSAIVRDAGDTSAAVETSGCVAGEISVRAGALSCTAFCAAALAIVCAAGETVSVCVSGTGAVSAL